MGIPCSVDYAFFGQASDEVKRAETAVSVYRSLAQMLSQALSMECLPSFLSSARERTSADHVFVFDWDVPVKFVKSGLEVECVLVTELTTNRLQMYSELGQRKDVY